MRLQAARSALLVAALAARAFCAPAQSSGAFTLNGAPADPFAIPAQARVFLFVRTDCPITNRYAPELGRLAHQFAGRGVSFWLIYPDRSETPQSIRTHTAQYALPGTPLRDPNHMLVKLAHATVAPEAAVFDAEGKLRYHGRIDDRYAEIGVARPEAQTHDLENAVSAVLDGHPIAHAETRAVGCSLADIE